MHHHHKKDGGDLEKRSGQCQFPTDAGLIAVTPKGKNAGWAMSPDKPCKPGMYCPYACPSGELMAQWDPKATEYKYPDSMNGGLYCNSDGEIEKPFPDKPYCTKGAGTVESRSATGKSVAFCQTVLPGDEDMLIPTNVETNAVLAVPDPSYWASTAAHYFINPPGVPIEDGCIWGTKDKPHGNWSPYVAGANQDKNGDTFVTLGWNPIYIEPQTPFRTKRPDFGVRIKCEGTCTGLPCEINPDKHDVNEITKPESSGKVPGAGGAHFCVVNVKKGGKAVIEVFNSSGSSGSSGSSKSVTDLGSSKELKKEVTEKEEEAPAPSASSTPKSKVSPNLVDDEMVGGNTKEVAAKKKPSSNESDDETNDETNDETDDQENSGMSAAEAAMHRVAANKNVNKEEIQGQKGTTVDPDAPTPEATPKSAGVSMKGTSMLGVVAAAAVAVMLA
ncbi:hypothetical protein EX30DRAFT_310450 [Ascodesmis nigricans]|uniref:SUN-domain-containing protein n=1 Tax=Ascodesmis nigricans TaxID=341454 RepID=A0A4S2MS05_9PEZI|nr:hypothetical protein EX30DRAFT_310450 [Ascodesmis nigricans]